MHNQALFIIHNKQISCYNEVVFIIHMLRFHSHIDTTLFLYCMKPLVYAMNNVPWELIQLNKLPITRNGLLSGVLICICRNTVDVVISATYQVAMSHCCI